MKEIKVEEKLKNIAETFFDEEFFRENDSINQQMSVFQSESALENSVNSQNEIFLDNFLSLVKIIFIYVPGAMLINMVGMFVKMLILYGDSFPNLFPELLGAALIGTFLIMMGIGKLSDLNYLKVPAATLAMSVLLSAIHSIIWIFDAGKSEGLYWLISFPIVIIWGYVVKRFLDKD